MAIKATRWLFVASWASWGSSVILAVLTAALHQYSELGGDGDGDGWSWGRMLSAPCVRVGDCVGVKGELCWAALVAGVVERCSA
jgi:hypothetical protein